MNRNQILEDAAQKISVDREADYGRWSSNAEMIAAGWRVIAQNGITARKVSLMMEWVKIVRQIGGPHLDSAVDAAGYAALGGELDEQLKVWNDGNEEQVSESDVLGCPCGRSGCCS